MALSSLGKRKLLLSREIIESLQGGHLTYMDIGARGELEEPWSLMPKPALKVVGFEPDPEECGKLNEKSDTGREYIPAAVWREETVVTFHINAVPSTSSVYPANKDLIEKFAKRHWEPRLTHKTVEVPTVTLDHVLKKYELDPDFLKIDTQGGEFSILEGANKTLTDHVAAVLIEAWTSEVYRGQHLSGEIMELMAKFGFTLYDVNIAAAWTRQRAIDEGLAGKPQVVGLDLLFIKDNAAELFRTGGALKVLKAAAIADMFGYSAAALDMIDDALKLNKAPSSALTKAAKHIRAIAKRDNAFTNKIKRKLYRILGVNRASYPSLHY